MWNIRILYLGAACGLLLTGCGSKSPPAETATRPPPAAVEERPAAPAPPPPPLEFASGRCRVYTSDPGWQVFVDGYPVRDPSGGYLATPCVVEALGGPHTLSIARKGRQDQSRQVQFAEEGEAVFDTTGEAAGESELLSAPYLEAPAGQAFSLGSVNSLGKEFDPYLSADGRALYFAADRQEGRGIYVATRPSPLHPFGQPVLLRLTSSSDQAASPSVTADATMIVYAIPSKGRLRALTRPSPLAEFDLPRILLTDDSLDARYPAAQIVETGDRIYFTRELQGLTETRVAFPKGGDSGEFGNVRIVQFPDAHPRLSADGLRQYICDGQVVRRARRAALNLPFSALEEVAKVKLPGFVPSPGYRQFCVSEDEQWLVYCDDPLAGGDLWMARLSEGPAWGVPLRGSTIAPRVIAAAPAEDMRRDPGAEEFVPPPPPVPQPEPPDPRQQPLPYLVYRQKLAELTGARQFEAAAQMIEAAQRDENLRSAAEVIDWDREDLQQLQQFWSDVEQALRQLTPGDKIRLGTVTVEFERYADGLIVAKARTKDVEKPLLELDASSVVSLAETVLDKEDPAQMLRAAVFLTYSGDGTSGRRTAFLKSAGGLGSQFEERLAGRESKIAELELARENVPAALQQMAHVEKEHPGTAAAALMNTLRESLFTRTRWKQEGRRTWQTGPQGEYTAAPNRVEGALLLSEQEAADFQLQMEYKTNVPTGQGGVYFKYTGRGRLDRNALKVQLSNDAGVNPDLYCTGALFGIEAPKVNAAKPQGEWNTLDLSVRGNRLRVRINGRDVLDTTFSAENRPAAGYIALDGIAGGITYRKVILSVQTATE